MKTLTKPNSVSKGIRFPVDLLKALQKAAKEDDRSLSRVTTTICAQYLASTNGKLLKNIKIIEGTKPA